MSKGEGAGYLSIRLLTLPQCFQRSFCRTGCISAWLHKGLIAPKQPQSHLLLAAQEEGFLLTLCLLWGKHKFTHHGGMETQNSAPVVII